MSFIFLNLFTILVATVIVLLYVFVKRKKEYFASRGIPYAKPTLLEIVQSLSMYSLQELPNDVYKRVRDDGHSIVGYFRLIGQGMIAVEPEVVEKILIKDFSHFQDHGVSFDISNEPLAGHLFSMKGDQWRTLRNKLLPTFTSGKLKGMVSAMDKCALNLIAEIKKNQHLNRDANLKDLFKLYTISVIGNCVFAIDPETIKDSDNEFARIVNRISSISILQVLKAIVAFTMPKLQKILKLKIFPKDVDDFFINLTRDALETRKKSGFKRNDFVQLLLELKEKGTVQVDARDLEEEEKNILQATQSAINNTSLEITDELLAAQAFVFIVGGFDNTSFLIALTMYVLSKYKDIQAQVRQEVKEALRKHGGMNYSALNDMKLLSSSINEALRIYPVALVLFRECTKTIQLDNGIVIEKGSNIMIPVKALQQDSKYWIEPEKFNPERFITDTITPGTYLPFGDGPRICIAQRLALLMSKVMLAQLHNNFELQPSSKTKEPMKIKLGMTADADGGFWGSFDALN